jgi:hypothetical protein
VKSFEQQFTDWVRSKPADEAYDYSDVLNCALCQFLRETGMAKAPLVGGYRWTEDDAETGWHYFDVKLDDAVCAGPHTFGALAERLQ